MTPDAGAGTRYREIMALLDVINGVEGDVRVTIPGATVTVTRRAAAQRGDGLPARLAYWAEREEHGTARIVRSPMIGQLLWEVNTEPLGVVVEPSTLLAQVKGVMRLHPVVAGVPGTLADVFVDHAEGVEHDQPLLALEIPASRT